jgi:hypothetical protein
MGDVVEFASEVAHLLAPRLLGKQKHAVCPSCRKHSRFWLMVVLDIEKPSSMSALCIAEFDAGD